MFLFLLLNKLIRSIKSKKLQKIIRTHQSRNLATQRMANDLERHLQVRNIKHQTQFDKLSAIARKCAENALAYHLENKLNRF
jgi:hypothetical protein